MITPGPSTLPPAPQRPGIDLMVETVTGEKIPVRVRELGISQFTRLSTVVDTEHSAAELYCGEPEGWSEKLTNAAIEEIVATGEKLNLEHLGRWVKRREERLKRVFPGFNLTQKIEAQVQHAAAQ